MKNLLVVWVVALGFSASALADSGKLSEPTGHLVGLLLNSGIQECVGRYSKALLEGNPSVTQDYATVSTGYVVSYKIVGRS